MVAAYERLTYRLHKAGNWIALAPPDPCEAKRIPAYFQLYGSAYRPVSVRWNRGVRARRELPSKESKK